MKSKYCFFIILLISVLFFYLIQYLTICEAGSITKLGTTAELLVGAGEFGSIFDDFNDGDSKNNWGYSTFNGGTGGTCTVSYAGGAYEGANCLKLDYNVPGAGSFSWYASEMGSENIESSNFNGLIFWVKGAAGGEYFKIELKTIDCNLTGRSNAKIYITDYLDGGVTTDWQKVVIPLKNFANITNFTKMYEFTIAFEYDQSLINGSLTSGTVYIDCIKFTNVTGGFGPIRIDHFGDKLDICALGGNLWSGYGGSGVSGSIEYSDVVGQYVDYKYGLKINYSGISLGPTGRWYSVEPKPGGGNNGWTNMQCDFSDYSKLTFYIKSQDGGQRPRQLQIVMEDGDGGWEDGFTAEVSGGSNPYITTTWQKFTIPFSCYGSINFGKLKKLSITINNWCTHGGPNGTVYIDKVQFEK